MTTNSEHSPTDASAIVARSPMEQRLRHLGEAIVARRVVVFLVCALSVAVLTLLFVGNRAFAGWQRSAALLAERRAEQKAMLLGVALEADMKAVQASVLGRFGGRRLAFRDPYDLFDIVSSAFSRFPYVDSIFIWRTEPDSPVGRLYVFSRAERQPVWAAGLQGTTPFPVTLFRDPQPLMPLVAAIRASDTREQFLLNEVTAGAGRYQVAASMFYGPIPQQQLVGAVGFLADLTWIRRHYFADLMKQVESVIGENGVAFSILDEHLLPVAASGSPATHDVAFERRFPLAFFDRSLLAAQSRLATVPTWTIRVSSSTGAESGMEPWRALWWLMSIASFASIVSVVLMAQSVRSMANLATMKSDFVATVTHELKTPLALIKAVSETLEFGRYTAENRIDEYGKLLRAEATRLTLRIDNLLAYARSNERGDAYQPEVVDLLDVIHESLHRAEPRLAAFELDANLGEAPLVSGDKGALLHVFDNLIDNAIKYSAERKRINVHTETADGMAVISIADQGIGITADDLERVFEKFFRGRSGRSGSGLGLAIADRVVRAHGGTISIASEVGRGTTVTVRLPLTNPV